MLWFTALFPGVVFFLLWGGSVWLPVGVVLGLAATGFAFSRASLRGGLLVGAIAAIAAFLLLFLDPLAPLIGIAEWIGGRITGAPFAVPTAFTVFGATLDLRELFPLLPHATGWAEGHLAWGIPYVASSEFGGFLLAILIGVTAIAFSLPLGILLALGRQSDLVIVKMICVGFIEFIRGVPLITLLFTASLLLGYFLPPGTVFDIILRVMILVTFFAAAYLAEVIRGGLAALPRGQYEAADALGLDYWRAQRLIILPQALKISIPGIVSTFIGLFKDTTLVSFVALLDPLRGVTNAIRADIDWKGIYWEPYIFVGAIFFVICFGMSRYSMYLEQKLKTDHR
jgi:general L-amino acid transport system permease protein